MHRTWVHVGICGVINRIRLCAKMLQAVDQSRSWTSNVWTRVNWTYLHVLGLLWTRPYRASAALLP